VLRSDGADVDGGPGRGSPPPTGREDWLGTVDQLAEAVRNLRLRDRRRHVHHDTEPDRRATSRHPASRR
jgi:hypothetical protein